MTTAQMLLFPEEAFAPAVPAPAASARYSKPAGKPSLPESAPAGTTAAQTAAPEATLPATAAIPTPVDARQRAEQLRHQLARLQGRPLAADTAEVPVYSTGGQVLDQLLPYRGLRPGTTVQWISQRSSDSAASLALIVAGQIARSSHSGGKPLVIFDLNKTYLFYPPAAISLGLPADRMVIVRRQAHHTAGDMLWAIDQALRCEAVAGVWAELGHELNDRDARRLQLAAEAGNTVGMWVRPETVRHQPSFADINWFVQTPRPAQQVVQSRSLQVTLDRCRGGNEGATAMIDILATAADASQRIVASTRSQHESTLVSDLARRLANPTTAKRSEVRHQVGNKQQAGTKQRVG